MNVQHPKERESLLHKAGLLAVRTGDMLVDWFIVLVFLLCIAYGSFAVWDAQNLVKSTTSQVYETYKPTVENTLSFAQLKDMNKDVHAWLSVYGTGIDYPVVQTTNNTKYLDTSVTGEYSLAGSIYLDTSNHPDYSDFNNIIYGHHMAGSAMFGDLDKFKDKAFFDSHKYGSLFLGGKEYGIAFFMFLEADGYDWTLYNTNVRDKQAYLAYLQSMAQFQREMDVTDTDRLVMLSTCASESTNGRYVLVGKFHKEAFENIYAQEHSAPRTRKAGFSVTENRWGMPTYFWAMAGLLLFLLLLLLLLGKAEARENKKEEEGEVCE